MDQVEGEAETGPVVRLRDEESAGRKGWGRWRRSGCDCGREEEQEEEGE